MMLKQLLLCIILVSIITDAKLTINKSKALKKRFMKRALNMKNYLISYKKGSECDEDTEDCSSNDADLD